jgi:hypothetical protein
MQLAGILLAAALAQSGDFTVVVLPDTQYYSCTDGGSCAGDLGIYDAQTTWIAANRDALDIRFVTSVGDCVEDADQQDQFDVAADAFGLLEAAVAPGHPDGIPYGIAVGNHDQHPASDPGSIPSVLDVLHPDQGATTTLFNATFGLDRFCPGGACRSYYGGHFGSNNDNHYALFDAGAYAFVVVHIEYMPVDAPLRRAVTAWADEVLTRHSDRRAIVVSHDVLERGAGAAFTDQGAALYDALAHHDNLSLILGGHRPGEGQRSDTAQGRTVHTLLADYQSRDDGGEGWLRILEFRPVTDTLSVRTYSPWLDRYEADADSAFVLPVDLGGGYPDVRASFQQGTDGYVGAEDTWIEQGASTHGTDPSLSWGTSPESAALLRFGSLFDTEGGPIPAGATITSATLHYVAHDAGDGANVHEVSVPWADTVDHAGFGPTAGIQAGEDYDPTPIAAAPGAARVHAVDVTASVSAWSADPSWIFVPTGADGVRIRSAEDATDPRDRPRLAVRYADPSRPNTVLLTDIDAAFVSDAAPNTRFVGTLAVDTASTFKHAFVKPRHLGGLAPGDHVVRARIVLPIVDAGADVELREVLEPWDLATLTWTNAPSADAAFTTFPGSPTGEVAVDVTDLVQRWVDGAPVHGLNLYPTGGNGVDIDGDVRFVVDVLGGGCADADGDGHTDGTCGGDDCDDADPGAFPGAPEVCGDAVDQDCDGVADCTVGPRTVVLTELEDAHVSSAAPDANLGSAAALEVDTASAFKHALLRPVDLGDIAPGALVVRADLVLQVSDPGAAVEVREVLGSWDEATVTWSTAPATAPPTTTFPGTAGQVSIDVTSIVQRWVDGAPLHGVDLYPTGANGVDIHSADHATPALRPHLVVEVTEPAGACPDADGDGHTAGCGGQDCDDADSGVHPGAPEVCGDGVDNDCDGGIDCPRSVLLTDIDDAHVSDAAPDANLGGATALEVDTAGTFLHAFVKPSHLGGIAPGAQVLRAELVLRVFGSGDDVEIREVLGAWDEATVTWSTAPAAAAPMTTFPGDAGEVSVDVTALVQGWVDGAPVRGVNLYPTGGDGVDLHSADHPDSTVRPYLVVEVLD